MSNALRWLAQLRAGDLIRAPFADVPIALIDPQDIAAVAAVVIGSDQHHGSSCELSGPEALVPAEQVRVLGTALGRDLRFEGQTEAEAREELSKIFPPSFVEAQLRFFAKGEFDDSRIAATVSEITGRPAGRFAQWARRHANRFAEGREGSS